MCDTLHHVCENIGRGRSGRETPGDLLEGEVVADLQEGGEEPLAGDPALQVVIGAAQTTQDIEQLFSNCCKFSILIMLHGHK